MRGDRNFKGSDSSDPSVYFLFCDTVEKAKRTAIEKDIFQLRTKMNKAQKDVDDAQRAADKLNNSLSKRIEDVVINEMPSRYMRSGLQNWALLNKDVAVLQKHLKGNLPSRENVLKLLNEVVLKNVSNVKREKKSRRSSCTATTAIVDSETDHRMSSHKRLLSEDYSINFPTPTKKPALLSSRACPDFNDFKLALKLQQEEMESLPAKVSASSTMSTAQFRDDGLTNYDEANPLRKEASNDFAEDVQDDANTGEENFELEADAAAAPLHLRRNRST